MDYSLFLTWIEKVIQTFSTIGGWLTTPLEYINIAPLWLITGTGLVAFLVTAIIKWVIN